MEKNIPIFLIEKLNKQYGKELSEKIVYGLTRNRKTTFRINKIKTDIDEIENILNENNIEFVKTDFYEDSFILEENSEEKIKNLDIYKEGKIYLQSLSSMMPVLVLDPKEKDNILDMCSAPRWKDKPDCKSNK